MSEASKPHSEHPGVHAETIPTRERIAKAHSRLPAEWHGWHAKLANGGYGHFAYHNAREACYICTLLDDLDGLEEQLQATETNMEMWKAEASAAISTAKQFNQERDDLKEQYQAAVEAIRFGGWRCSPECLAFQGYGHHRDCEDLFAPILNPASAPDAQKGGTDA